MMKQILCNPIGKVSVCGETVKIILKEQYIPALRELEGFSHINVVWWFSGCDGKDSRQVLEVESPYRHGPQRLGVFATRSPERPNPLALSAAEIIGIDYDAGSIELAYIDAWDESPVLDLKPYTPSLDRVGTPAVPAWCSHWPKTLEESGQFCWEEEFQFEG